MLEIGQCRLFGFEAKIHSLIYVSLDGAFLDPAGSAMANHHSLRSFFDNEPKQILSALPDCEHQAKTNSGVLYKRDRNNNKTTVVAAIPRYSIYIPLLYK